MKQIKQSRFDTNNNTRYYHSYNYYSGSGESNEVYGVREGYETIIGWVSFVLSKYHSNINVDLSYHIRRSNGEVEIIRVFL